MRREPLLRMMTVGIIGWLCIVTVQAAEQPMPIGRDVPQLFVDDYLIADATQAHRTLHQPVKENGGNVPLIASRPGSSLTALGTIVYDPRIKRYVMFCDDYMGNNHYRVTSADGLDWGCTQQSELRPTYFNFRVWPEKGARGASGPGTFACYYDADNERFPYQGWVYYANVGDHLEGVYYTYSADGITWEGGKQVVDAYAGSTDTTYRSITQDHKTVHGPGDVTLFGYDPVAKKILGLFKFYRPETAKRGNGLRSRAYLFLDRLSDPVDVNRIERIALLPSTEDGNGETCHDEYYGSTAWRYGNLWLGELKVYHRTGDFPYSAAGCAFMKLVVSRDGLNWHRVPFANEDGIPEVYIPNGPEGGNKGQNDGGYMRVPSQGPLRIGDELIYYYSASSWGKNYPVTYKSKHVKGGGIFRARLRVDGFVSVDRGTITTRPLAFEGRELTLNSVGPVRIEVLDGVGMVLARAGVDGDSLRHRVRFDGRSLAEVAPSGAVRLRFTVEEKGRLYAFAVR